MEADDFLGASCRKSMAPKSHGLYFFPRFAAGLGHVSFQRLCAGQEIVLGRAQGSADAGSHSNAFDSEDSPVLYGHSSKGAFARVQLKLRHEKVA